jgi:glutathione peroxidase-family protein
MAQLNNLDKNNCLYQYYKYQGQFTPENLAFNANLQEFSQRVTYICNLETRGKLSPQESYEQIEDLWKQLTNSFQTLGIGEDVSRSNS